MTPVKSRKAINWLCLTDCLSTPLSVLLTAYCLRFCSPLHIQNDLPQTNEQLDGFLINTTLSRPRAKTKPPTNDRFRSNYLIRYE